MPDRDAVSVQPAWEQSMWQDREKGFNHFLALLLWPAEMNPCMKVQEAKWRTGKGGGCNLQLTLTTPAQKRDGNLFSCRDPYLPQLPGCSLMHTVLKFVLHVP